MDIFRGKQAVKFLSYDFNIRVLFILLLVNLYVLLFRYLHSYLGDGVPIISLFPVVFAGWLLGLRVGIIAGVLMVPLNFFLMERSGSSLSNAATLLLGSVSITLVGGVVGWLSDLLSLTNEHYQARLAAEESMYLALKKANDFEQDLEKEKRSVEEKVVLRTSELEEERSRLEASINSLNVGFIITDTDNEIVNMNSTAKRLLCLTETGRTTKSGVLLDPLSINSRCDIHDIAKQLEGSFDIKKNLKLCYEQRRLIDVGDIEFRDVILHFFMSPIVMYTNKLNVIGSVILIEDITKEKVLERSRDEFFSIASHELRTPLTSIRGNTSLIQQFYEKQLQKDKNLSEMVSDIHESSVRLIEIVNDFLDTSRLEQGRLTFNKEVFEFKPLVEDVLKEINGIATQRKLYLKTTFEPRLGSVIADRNRVKQVLINLAGNSLKFTEKGGVEIKVSSQKGFLKISVSDTGKGIDTKNQKLLFHKFQQATTSILTRDNTRGTGLGLYISKMMIEGMGGQIGLEKSIPGQGTTFSFTLPLAANVDEEKTKVDKKEIVQVKK